MREYEYVLSYKPLAPSADEKRTQPFTDDEYVVEWKDDFEDVAHELIQLSVRLLESLPDPSLSPNERLERLARVVPSSQIVTAHRRTARSKLYELRRRLEELVPDSIALGSAEKLSYLFDRLDELVPGKSLRTIQKLEKLGDYRSTDIGVTPRNWR